MEPASPLTYLSTSPLPSIPSNLPTSPNQSEESTPCQRSRKRPSRHRRRSTLSKSPSPSTASFPSAPVSDSPSVSSSVDSSHSSTSVRSIKRRKRIPEVDKLIDIIDRLKDLRWDIADFLRAICKHSGNHRFRRNHSRFLKYANEELPGTEDFSHRLGQRRVSRLMEVRCWDWTRTALRQEIKALASSPSFGPFQPPAEPAEFGSPSQIKGCGDTIQVLTPRWLELLDAAATERVSLEASVPQSIQPAGRHTLILGLLCYKMRPNKSTNI